MPSTPEERPQGERPERAEPEREQRPDLRPPAGNGDVDDADVQRSQEKLDQVIPK